MVHSSGLSKLDSLEEFVPFDQAREVNSKDLMTALTCEKKTSECFLGECRDCSGKREEVRKKIKQALNENNIQEVSYDLWGVTDRPEKVTVRESAKDFTNHLMTDLEKCRVHDFIAKKQYQSYLKLKEDLPDDEAIVVGDFSENYSIPNQREIQSAYFAHRQTTIHPWVAYFKEENEVKSKSILMVSDSTKHDTVAVSTFQTRVVADVKQLVPDLRKIHYWSDGCAGQYKNCKNISNVISHREDHGVDATWSFWATSHGKGNS